MIGSRHIFLRTGKKRIGHCNGLESHQIIRYSLVFLYCQACFVQVLSIGSKSAHEQRSSADMFMCIHSHVLLHNYRSRVVCAHTHDNVPCMFVQVHMGCVFVLLFCQEPMASLGGQCGGEGLSVVEGHCRREHRLELWQWHRQKQLQQWQCTGICRDRGHNRSFCGNGSAQSLHRGRDAGWHVSLNHGSCCAKKKTGLAARTWALISPQVCSSAFGGRIGHFAFSFVDLWSS